MRLFEVDLGSARSVLAVLQGQANKSGDTLTIPFASVLKLIAPLHLGIDTPQGLIALKNEVDPQGDIIQDILDDGSLVIGTNRPDQTDQDTTGGSSVDQMASSAASQAINSKI